MPKNRMSNGPDGLLLVDKPGGVSSHDVVSVARRVIGERRIGHGGTLDPFATGLLVLLVGRATRLLPHLPGEPKVYLAELRFGSETDTEDLDGEVVREASLPSRSAVLGALQQFVGAIAQVPSTYSAKRVDGQRAYARARAGETVTLAPVTVRIHRLEVVSMTDGPEGVAAMSVRVWCGGGTYIRALARDLGRAAGSAAHLVALRRESSGPFNVKDALTLERLKSEGATVRPALEALPGFPVQRVGADDVLRIVRGIDVAAELPGAWGALVHEEHGVLVALAERRDTRWAPRVVMREP